MAPEEGRVQWRNAQGDKDVHGPDAHFSAVTRYPTTFPSQLSVLVLTALLELSKRNTEETLPLPPPLGAAMVQSAYYRWDGRSENRFLLENDRCSWNGLHIYQRNVSHCV